MTFRAAPLKRIARLNPETLSEATDPDFKFDYIDIGSVGRGQLVETPTPTRFGDAPSRARRLVREGDTIVSSVRTYLRAVLPVRGFADKTVVSTGFVVCRPGVGIDPDFLSWALQADSFIEEVVARSIGVSYPAINPSEVGRILVPLPDHPTQRRVADFLDRETSRIDELIQAKRELSRLLTERLSALVETQLQDLEQGERWTRLGYHIDLLSGWAFPSSGFSRNPEDIRLLRGVNVGVNRCRWDDVAYWPSHATAGLERYILKVGDLVLGMDRPWIGAGMRVAEVTEDDLPALLLQRVARIRPRATLHPMFLKMLLTSQRFRDYFEPILTGVSVPHISPEQIYNFRFPLPSAHRQEGIAEAVYRANESTEDLRRALEQQIALLQERRQALITAAVTGQLDVTGDGAYEELEKASA